MESTGTIEVLTNLDGRTKIGREPPISLEVVIDDRLLDPGQPHVVNTLTSLLRLSKIEPLIEIHHEVHVLANHSPNRFDRRQVIRQPISSQP